MQVQEEILGIETLVCCQELHQGNAVGKLGLERNTVYPVAFAIYRHGLSGHDAHYLLAAPDRGLDVPHLK